MALRNWFRWYACNFSQSELLQLPVLQTTQTLTVSFKVVTLSLYIHRKRVKCRTRKLPEHNYDKQISVKQLDLQRDNKGSFHSNAVWLRFPTLLARPLSKVTIHLPGLRKPTHRISVTLPSEDWLCGKLKKLRGISYAQYRYHWTLLGPVLENDSV